MDKLERQEYECLQSVKASQQAQYRRLITTFEPSPQSNSNHWCEPGMAQPIRVLADTHQHETVHCDRFQRIRHIVSSADATMTAEQLHAILAAVDAVATEGVEACVAHCELLRVASELGSETAHGREDSDSYLNEEEKERLSFAISITAAKNARRKRSRRHTAPMG